MESNAKGFTNTFVTETDLDDLAVRILKLMNHYIDCKMNIENYIRSGCLDLAKARYITGNRNISSLQLPGGDSTGVIAKFRVNRTNNDGFIKFQSSDSSEFQEQLIEERLKNVKLDLENESSQKTIRFSQDPIKWFGFLVPQSLRQSKVTFEKCLEIVIECANIHSELQYCLESYKNRKTLVQDNQS